MRTTAAAAFGWLTAASAAGCTAEPPTPSKVEDPAALVGREAPAERDAGPEGRGGDSPFRNPNRDPPPARSEPQLAPAELDAVLAAARPLVAADDTTAALIELHKCANKIPQSGECETLLAILLLEHRLQEAHAHHFLAEVVARDLPDVTTEQLRQLARLAASASRFAEARKALQLVRDRGEAGADDFAALAQAEQARGGSKLEATVALAKAYELDSTRHGLLRDRAVLLAQLGEREQAIADLRKYRAAIASDAKEAAAVDSRIAALERELAPPEAAERAATRGTVAVPQ